MREVKRLAAKDYYRLLGVEQEASGEQIKKAYRELALQYHPDRNQGDQRCEELLKEVNEAYQVLGNEEKRRLYDLLGRQPDNSRIFYQQDSSDHLAETLRMFSRGGFGMRGFGGCRGRGFGRGGCRRWKGNF